MYTIITNVLLLLTIVVLMFLLWKLTFVKQANGFCWHRLFNRNNYYVMLTTSDGVTHVIDILIVDENDFSEIEIIKSNPNHYLIKIPKGTSLTEFQIKVSLDEVENKVIISLFSDMKTPFYSSSSIFNNKEDKKSCLELFGYLKQSLQYK